MAAAAPALAIDIGGTKFAAGLVGPGGGSQRVKLVHRQPGRIRCCAARGEHAAQFGRRHCGLGGDRAVGSRAFCGHSLRAAVAPGIAEGRAGMSLLHVVNLVSGVALGATWIYHALAARRGMPQIADLSHAEYAVPPETRLPRVMVTPVSGAPRSFRRNGTPRNGPSGRLPRAAARA